MIVRGSLGAKIFVFYVGVCVCGFGGDEVGGTDSFHGFEYFGLITLTSREFRVHSMRFFWHACVVYAFYGFVSVA